MRSVIVYIGIVWLFGLMMPGISLAQIEGKFATSATVTCLSVTPPATFDSSFKATAGPVFQSISQNIATVTFHRDGTGSFEGLITVSNSTPVPPGGFASQSSSSTWKLTYQFTYTVDRDLIMETLISGTYLQTFLTGPRAGQTATKDVQTGTSYISEDGKNYLSIGK
jgi:hypothetical protein